MDKNALIAFGGVPSPTPRRNNLTFEKNTPFECEIQGRCFLVFYVNIRNRENCHGT